ncbi:MAG: hypothetical protein ABL949_14870 [Fimbriimonadaceae bacterium]
MKNLQNKIIAGALVALAIVTFIAAPRIAHATSTIMKIVRINNMGGGYYEVVYQKLVNGTPATISAADRASCYCVNHMQDLDGVYRARRNTDESVYVKAWNGAGQITQIARRYYKDPARPFTRFRGQIVDSRNGMQMWTDGVPAP